MAPDHSDQVLAYLSRIKGYLRSLAKPWYPVEDLMNDTYITATEAIRRNGPPRRLRPWLMTVAKHTAWNHAEKETRLPREFVEMWSILDEEDLDPAYLADRSERLALIDRARSDVLTDRQQAVFDGYYRDGRPLKDLADQVSSTPDGAKLMIHRARNKIRGYLSEG